MAPIGTNYASKFGSFPHCPVFLDATSICLHQSRDWKSMQVGHQVLDGLSARMQKWEIPIGQRAFPPNTAGTTQPKK